LPKIIPPKEVPVAVVATILLLSGQTILHEPVFGILQLIRTGSHGTYDGTGADGGLAVVFEQSFSIFVIFRTPAALTFA